MGNFKKNKMKFSFLPLCLIAFAPFTSLYSQDLLDEIDEHQTPLALKERVEEFCGTFACHGSIRAGKKMSMAEMEALLRQMEQTPYSGQCNHGRPTYIRLHKHDIEKLFERR